MKCVFALKRLFYRVLVLGLALGLFACNAPSDNVVRGIDLALPDTVHLCTGDLVFRQGASLESNVVLAADGASADAHENVYTHVGMVLWVDSGWCVVHAVPHEAVSEQAADTVKLEQIGAFFRSDRALCGKVMRLKGIAPSDTLLLQQRALSIWNLKPLFDNGFDMNDTSSYYCTELVWNVYYTALDVDLSQGRRHRFPLLPSMMLCSDLMDSTSMECVWEW